MSSTGSPYTLYITLPLRTKSVEPAPPPDITTHPVQSVITEDDRLNSDVGPTATTHADKLEEQDRRKRVTDTARRLVGLYCPCAGFAYNSLSGDRNLLVSHQCKLLEST